MDIHIITSDIDIVLDKIDEIRAALDAIGLFVGDIDVSYRGE